MKRTLAASLRILAPVAALSTPSLSWAFPEMVRHGYVNCIACHVSPNGGGVLTPYGRELSRELLSTTGTERESKWAYLVKTPSWLDLGGDYRVLRLYQNTPSFTDQRTIQMQADLEASLNYKNQLYLVGTAGYANVTNPTFISRRYYLDYRPVDQLSFRVGKFLYAYGINTPDHTVSVKRDLQINDEGTESYNFEAAWIGENTNLYLTGILGRPDAPELHAEKGVAISPSLAVTENSRIGASYLHASSDLESRDVVGPNAILGFTPQFYLLAELDLRFQSSPSSPDTTSGFVDYMKLGYEFFRGFHGYLTQELMRPNFANLDGLKKTYGIGILFYPRPHFELEATWDIQVIQGINGYSNLAYLMFHFYP